ncbi:hypothetical protein EBT16_11090 [bacterium]|nr:hypothetical protein [bacterium]
MFGGSAGREKTAVQLSTWASDQLAGRLKPAAEERKTLLLAAMGAGFGSAVGAPWAGVVFGMESLGSKLTIKSFFSCLVASFCASLTTKVLGAPHTVYPAPHFISFSLKTILSVGASAVCFGTLAFCFKETLQKLERFLKTSFPTVPKRLFVGGTVLVALYAWEGSYRYVGLGIPLIQESFYQTSPFTDVFFKAFFTALTLASGFKGGEFIPLVFMGTTLGSYLSQWLPVSSNLLGALGFAAVFGAVSRTPWACTLVTIELFGYPLTLYGFITCFLAFRTCKYLGKSAKRHID